MHNDVEKTFVSLLQSVQISAYTLEWGSGPVRDRGGGSETPKKGVS